MFNGWHNPGDIQLVGDFTGAGHAQVLFINTRAGSGGRVMIADFASGNPPAQVRYWEDWGNNPTLDGWHNPGDIQLVGDFTGAGHAQVLFINTRAGSGGRVMIADFASGNPPAQVRYWEDWGNNPTLDGWHDPGDIQLVGDFTGAGHAEVLFINTRAGSGGRVMIADFASGNPPAQVRYWEDWGNNPTLDGWHNPGDIQLVGDFTGAGHAQVLFINTRAGSGGRVMIADFASGNPPAQVRYWEDWGNNPTLDGWHDPGDIQLVGDFTGAGHAQVLFINTRAGSGGRVMIADFASGNPPAQVRYWEDWGNNPTLDGWHDLGDIQLGGDFTGAGHAQILFINRNGRLFA